MIKVLLIDDEADKGWEIVLTAILKKEVKGECQLEPALNRESAKEMLEKKWDLIFLDLRFSESDYETNVPEELSGAGILTEFIRDRNSMNFSTPVIVFTASRRIWNIDRMIDLGADGYYIKESPYEIADDSFSTANYRRLADNIKNLLKLNQIRSDYWSRTKKIEESISRHIEIPNIRTRIKEKLGIAYGLLSGSNRKFEVDNFLYTKEDMAFLVYFSILEEISKANYEKVWDDLNEIEWKIQGTDKYLVKLINEIDDTIEVGIQINSKGPPWVLSSGDNGYKNWAENKIRLSHQIKGLLILKYNSSKDSIDEFFELNDHRNNLDFTHSSPEIIFNETIGKSYDKTKSLEFCKRIFDFIYMLLVEPDDNLS